MSAPPQWLGELRHACPEVRVELGAVPAGGVRCAQVAVDRQAVLRLVDAEAAATVHRVPAAAARTALSVYAIRLCQATVLPWVLGGVLVRPADVGLGGDGGHGFDTIYLNPAADFVAAQGDSAEVVAREVFDDHLLAVARQFGAVRGCALPAAQGQVGFGLGASLARASRAGLPAGPLITAYRQLVAAVPWLAGTGRVVTVENPSGREVLVYLRSRCCLWWTAPGQQACQSCPRRSDDERLAVMSGARPKT